MAKKPTYEDIKETCNHPEFGPKMVGFLAGAQWVYDHEDVRDGIDDEELVVENTPATIHRIISVNGAQFHHHLHDHLRVMDRWRTGTLEPRIDGALVKDAATGVAMLRHYDCAGDAEIVKRQPKPVKGTGRTCAGCGQPVKTIKVEVYPETVEIGAD